MKVGLSGPYSRPGKKNYFLRSNVCTFAGEYNARKTHFLTVLGLGLAFFLPKIHVEELFMDLIIS